MPYTFVLTPPTNQAMKYIEASQMLFSDCQPSYLLTGSGKSSPHITVVQFECEYSLAQDVWLNLCMKMREVNFASFSPQFIGVTLVDGTGPYEGTTWVELSVKRGDINSPIMKVHYAALEMLQCFNLQSLNASANDYRPHLTLARIVMPKQLKAWPKTLYENPGNFKLEFGVSDEKWQYAQTLKIF